MGFLACWERQHIDIGKQPLGGDGLQVELFALSNAVSPLVSGSSNGSSRSQASGWATATLAADAPLVDYAVDKQDGVVGDMIEARRW